MGYSSSFQITLLEGHRREFAKVLEAIEKKNHELDEKTRTTGFYAEKHWYDCIQIKTHIMNKTKTYYQPYLRGFNSASAELPDELYSFQAFKTKEDCRNWLDLNGYANCDYFIETYHNEDIEGVTILDANGDIIETNEDECE